MAGARDDGEIARIIRTAERAFGRAAKMPLLELDLDQRVGSRRRWMPALLGGLVLMVTVIGLALVIKDRAVSRLPGAAPGGAVIQHLPTAPQRAPEPAPPSPAAGQAPSVPRPAPRPAAVQARSRTVAARRAKPSRKHPIHPSPHARPHQTRSKRPLAHHGAIADPLYGEALQRALAADRVRTRELNRAELKRDRSR